MPAGNSVAALQLLRLARLTGEYRWEEMVGRLLEAASLYLEQYPSGHAYLLQALLLLEHGLKEVVIIRGKDAKADPVLRELEQGLYSEVVWLVLTPEEASRLVFTKEFTAMNGMTTYYVCEQNACQQPTTDAKKKHWPY